MSTQATVASERRRRWYRRRRGCETAMSTNTARGFESRDDRRTDPTDQLETAIATLEAVDWRRTSISPAEAGAFVARLQEARERQEADDE